MGLYWLMSHNKMRNGLALLEDAQTIRRYSWKAAYYDCLGCFEFMKKHLRSYEARYSFKSLSLPSAIAIILVVVSFLLAAHNEWKLFVAIILAVSLAIVTFIVYFLYFYYIDYHLMFCSNRIEIYESTWPGIIRLISEKTERHDFTLPEELKSRRQWFINDSKSADDFKPDFELVIGDHDIICNESSTDDAIREKFDQLYRLVEKMNKPA